MPSAAPVRGYVGLPGQVIRATFNLFFSQKGLSTQRSEPLSESTLSTHNLHFILFFM